METNYILHGGNINLVNKTNDFMAKIFSLLNGVEVNVLLVYLAKDPEHWDKMFQEDVLRFNRYSQIHKYSFEIADIEPSKLSSQLKKTDVVFIRGGDVLKLIYYFGKIPRIKELLEGKIVFGSSAGACLLSMYFYSNDYGKIMSGLGVLPIKVFCHYEDQKELIEKLNNHKENIPIFQLRESTYQHIKN